MSSLRKTDIHKPKLGDSMATAVLKRSKTWSAASRAGADRASFIPAIEGLRAVAVLCVVAFHLNPSLLPGGFIGVDIFFVISGYVVTGSLVNTRFDRISDLLLWFYVRRILRIVPALVVMLLVSSLLCILFVPDAWLSQSTYIVGAAAYFGVSNIALAFSSDNYFSPRIEYNPFVHTWSLGVEEQFYFVFPFLMYWHQNHLRRNLKNSSIVRVLAILVVSSLALSAALTMQEWNLAFYMMPPRFWELGCGMILCVSIGAWRPRLQATPQTLKLAATIVSFVLIAIALGPFTDRHFPFPMAIFPVAGTVGLIALFAACAGGAVQATLASGLMTAIGRRSYSLYLWHFPIFALFRWTVGLDQWPLAALALGLTLSFAEVSYQWIEQPFRKHFRFEKYYHGRTILIGLVVLAVSAVATDALRKAKTNLSFSVTADHRSWYADEMRTLTQSASQCDLVRTAGSVDKGQWNIWTPVGCTFPRPPGRLFVIGDSHALAYNPLLRQFAADNGIELRMYFASGCPFLNLLESMTSRGSCVQYYAEALAQLDQQLRSDDVLFLPSLRLPRFIDQWGSVESGVDNEESARLVIMAEARAMLARLSVHGPHIVFELPLPIFRSPPFRCADWFNSSNPVCVPGLTMATTELIQLRKPAVSAIRDLARVVPNLTTWDPFPALCGPQTCTAISADGPLFFDADHLSGHGNDVLYSSFSATMNPLFKK